MSDDVLSKMPPVPNPNPFSPGVKLTARVARADLRTPTAVCFNVELIWRLYSTFASPLTLEKEGGWIHFGFSVLSRFNPGHGARQAVLFLDFGLQLLNIELAQSYLDIFISIQIISKTFS